MPGSDYVLPPAPPPDLAPDEWASRQSGCGRRVRSGSYLTHGGPFEVVAEHLDQLMPNVGEVEEICRAAMSAGADDAEVTALFQAHTERRLGFPAVTEPGIVQR